MATIPLPQHSTGYPGIPASRSLGGPMSKVFGQASRLLQIADEAGWDADGGRFEALNRSGILSDVMKCPDPRAVNRDALRKVLTGMLVEVKGFAIWRTLQIGGISREAMLGKVTEGGDFVSDWARGMMNHERFTTSPRKKTLRLARAKVGELGFTEMPTTTELFARIRQVGSLCPAEVGPRLRYDYQDQPNSEILWVAMETIPDLYGDPYVFAVRREVGGRRWLYAGFARPDGQWGLERGVVFVPRK